MKKIKICLLLILLFSGSISFAQSDYEKYRDLLNRYKEAVVKKDNMPERYKLVEEFFNLDASWFQRSFQNWARENNQKYRYVARLLKDSNEPQDLLHAVEYYNYFLHNYINSNNYKDIYSYETVGDRLELSQIYLSGFLYYCISKQISYAPEYAVSESCKWIDDGKLLYSFPKAEINQKFILGLDTASLKNFSPQAYKIFLVLNHAKNAQVMNQLGIKSKNDNDVKNAKAWYKAAIEYGNEDAKTNLANVNKKVESSYGLFDYRRTAPFADATYQTLDKPTYTSTATLEETKKYNEWWEQTYGRGGSQNRTPMPNYNVAPARYTPSKLSDADQHKKNMEQITRETEKQLNNGFKN
ncbi:hypothetical protein [Ferruginibacter sp. HRS2-29]|uniref:hypothetical protein n=1 Tax=Ferruginibacter sp. HRS2-29 TaxID=2487334 RepID=UPI0020CC99B9|nr:hypothetical protein [Ferruginibacter sp. HRS2-29]